MLGKFEFYWFFHDLMISEKISTKNQNTRLWKIVFENGKICCYWWKTNSKHLR